MERSVPCSRSVPCLTYNRNIQNAAAHAKPAMNKGLNLAKMLWL